MASKDFATGVATGVIASDIFNKAANISQNSDETSIIYKKCIEPNQTLFTEKECYIAIEKHKKTETEVSPELKTIMAISIFFFVFVLFVYGLAYVILGGQKNKDELIDAVKVFVPVIIIIGFLMYVVN